MKTIFSIVLILVFVSVFGQDSSDAERLRQMDYMKLAEKIDCDSTSGSNMEHRICLNLEFQELDSLMNNNFRELLKRTENDSIKTMFCEFQLTWVDNRRLQSELISEGYTGHMLGIVYLHCMVEATRSRNKELEEILNLK